MERKMKSDGEKIRSIIADAGGQIIGRTRFQKIAYLLELAGEGEGFHFGYHYYGPYSEELTHAASVASTTGTIQEETKDAKWGGSYSIYKTDTAAKGSSTRQHLAATAGKANAIVLELAATAAYFADDNESDPWGETQRRKPDKAADGRLENAKVLYEELRAIAQKLPQIPT